MATIKRNWKKRWRKRQIYRARDVKLYMRDLDHVYMTLFPSLQFKLWHKHNVSLVALKQVCLLHTQHVFIIEFINYTNWIECIKLVSPFPMAWLIWFGRIMTVAFELFYLKVKRMASRIPIQFCTFIRTFVSKIRDRKPLDISHKFILWEEEINQIW